MSAPKVCKQCGGTDLEYSEARGETYCLRCGDVLAESTMVDTIQFTETASGAKAAVGRFIPGGFASAYGSTESREQTLHRGNQHMQRIAETLKMPLHLVDSAQRIFLLAVQRSFTIGRQITWVVGVCLYAVCRREKAPYLLMDFSDALRVPVHKLGSLFNKLQRVLSLKLPSIIPEIFLARFAEKLPLEGMEEATVATAVRLIQAMQRDWICTGRRPHGLCGASLLIAGRMHGVKLHADDVASVVRMSSCTVDRRLSEFKRSAMAQLPMSQFEATDLAALPVAPTPPCWGAAEKRAARRKKFLALPGCEPLPLPYYKMRPRALEGDSTSEEPLTGKSLACMAADIVRGLMDAPTGGEKSDALVREISNVVAKRGELIEDLEKAAAEATTTPEKEVQQERQEATDLFSQLFGEGDGLPQEGFVVDALAEQALAIVQGGSGEDAEVTETLSDVSDGEIQDMLLDEEARIKKALIWDELTKNIMGRVEARWAQNKRRRNGDDGKQRKRTALHPAATAGDSIRLAFDLRAPPSAVKMFTGDGTTDAFQDLFSI